MDIESLKAVIPAAGKGIRLAELTRKHSKVMLKFNGKPLLWHTLNSLKEIGIRNIIIIVGYKGDEIINYFSSNMLGLNITYVKDERMAGTATAIKAAENEIESTFLMIFGDVFPESGLLRSLIKKHMSIKKKIGSRIAATLSVTKVDDPHNHAPILFDTNEEVIEIWSSRSMWVDMGIMMLEPVVFKAINHTPLVRGEYRILKSISIVMKWGYRVFAYKSSYPWIQIGDHTRIMSLINVNDYFLNRARINNYIEDSFIHNSRLFKTSVIKSKIINSELSHCIVYEGAEIISSSLKNCVINEGIRLRNVRGENKIFSTNL